MSPLDQLEWMFKMQTAPSETAAIIIEPILGALAARAQHAHSSCSSVKCTQHILCTAVSLQLLMLQPLKTLFSHTEGPLRICRRGRLFDSAAGLPCRSAKAVRRARHRHDH